MKPRLSALRRAFVSVCLLAGVVCAQTTIVVKNGGTPAGYYKKYFPLNIVNGGCVPNGTTGDLDCTFAAAGTVAFSGLTGGTNTSAAMLVGAGGSLGTTSTGIIKFGGANQAFGAFYFDVGEIAAPSNPSASTCRFSIDSTSHLARLVNSSGADCWPTFNQNTTGSAAKWTTARNLAGNSVDGSANVNFANKFIAQGTSDSGLSGAQFLGSLGTGIVKNTTTTGVLSIAAGSDVVALWASGSCSGFLKSDLTCSSAGGTGTVTVVASGSLTSTALVTGGGTTTLQTAATTATMDSSGNISTPGSVTTGAGGSVAGELSVGQGTAPSLLANGFSIFAPTGITTGYGWQMPTTENSSDGVLLVPAASSHVSLPVVGLLPLADMATQGADTFVGNATGSTAKPTAVSMPSCAADGSHALTYPSHVLTCTSISGGSTPTVLYWANNVTIGTSQGTPTQNHTYCWGPYQQAANITYSEASVYIQTASTGGGNTDFGFYTLNGITPSVSVATLNGHWGAKAGGALTGGQNNNFTVSGAPKTINSATWYLACVTSSDTASWTLLGIGSPNATLLYNGSDMSSTTSGGVLATSFTLPASPTAWAAGRDVNVAAIP